MSTALVDRNTTIPAERKQTFSTAADNQTAVTIKVCQGERSMARDNRLLGEFNLEGIPAAPRGVPQIEVTFDIDQNGILNVSAKDLGTNKEASVRIEESSGLSEDEIGSMRDDAEQHAEDDRKAIELVEARNQADQLCYQIEKTISENAETLSDGDKEPLEESIARVRELAQGEDSDAIKAAVSELEQTAHALSKTLYENSQSESEESAATNASDDDDAIDAEFEVKEEEEEREE